MEFASCSERKTSLETAQAQVPGMQWAKAEFGQSGSEKINHAASRAPTTGMPRSYGACKCCARSKLFCGKNFPCDRCARMGFECILNTPNIKKRKLEDTAAEQTGGRSESSARSRRSSSHILARTPSDGELAGAFEKDTRNMMQGPIIDVLVFKGQLGRSAQ